ncbi:hypothetical protein [Hymenobacter sp. GOD-10R]|nr:hypothetical protein [Hymenobacter sp. GOD-10R]WRQ30644.1 hypothetical protein SD425_10265 [Hymenobacter sp. GOD-10R]
MLTISMAYQQPRLATSVRGQPRSILLPLGRTRITESVFNQPNG